MNVRKTIFSLLVFFSMSPTLAAQDLKFLVEEHNERFYQCMFDFVPDLCEGAVDLWIEFVDSTHYHPIWWGRDENCGNKKCALPVRPPPPPPPDPVSDGADEQDGHNHELCGGGMVGCP